MDKKNQITNALIIVSIKKEGQIDRIAKLHRVQPTFIDGALINFLLTKTLYVNKYSRYKIQSFCI